MRKGTADFVYDKAVGTKGNEIDRNIGRFESRVNVTKGGADFEHELLRMYEAYVAEYERVTDAGFKLFTGSVAAGHEWNAIGVTQSYIAGSSTSTAWGQQKLTVMVMSGPFGKAYIGAQRDPRQVRDAGRQQWDGELRYARQRRFHRFAQRQGYERRGRDGRRHLPGILSCGVIYSYVNGDTVSVASR